MIVWVNHMLFFNVFLPISIGCAIPDLWVNEISVFQDLFPSLIFICTKGRIWDSPNEFLMVVYLRIGFSTYINSRDWYTRNRTHGKPSFSNSCKMGGMQCRGAGAGINFGFQPEIIIIGEGYPLTPANIDLGIVTPCLRFSIHKSAWILMKV